MGGLEKADEKIFIFLFARAATGGGSFTRVLPASALRGPTITAKVIVVGHHRDVPLVSIAG
jgi:hypothetical protein